MSNLQIAEIRKKISKGLKLARKQAISKAILHNTEIVISENGKMKFLDPKEISN